MVAFEVIPPIEQIETFASGSAIRERNRLVKQYGGRNWRKCKGFAKIRVANQIRYAELHWYEAHGIGRVEMKIKHLMEHKR